MHASNGLYLANCNYLLDSTKPDVSLWGNIFKVVSINVPPIDRSGFIRMPYRFQIFPTFEMPTFRKLTKTYEQCCDERAAFLIKQSNKLNKPLAIMYSGGVDSTLVVISLLKQLGRAKFRNQVELYLNQQSIAENPKFFEEHVSKLRYFSSERFTTLFDKKRIVVGGEFNDQLFGSDIIGDLCLMFGEQILSAKYSRNILEQFFIQRGMPEEVSKAWCSLLEESVQHSNLSLTKAIDYIWWMNFNFKWQSVYFRMPMRAHATQIRNLKKDFFEKYFFQFFGTEDFQLWSINNREPKIKNTWKSYKFAAKQVIFDFTKDTNYRDNKTKFGSLSHVFINKSMVNAVTSNLEFIYNIQKSDFYESNNWFKKHLS